MNKILQFNRFYFVSAILLFGIEVLIARYVHDQIIRPYIGDLLVVILLYCFIKAFVNVAVGKVAVFVLLFSYTLECLQYFQFVYRIGLGDSKIARIVIGTYFEWIDLAMYTVGIVLVIFFEKVAANRQLQKDIKTP